MIDVHIYCACVVLGHYNTHPFCLYEESFQQFDHLFGVCVFSSNIVSVHELMKATDVLADSSALNGGGGGGVEISTFADVDAELAMVDSGRAPTGTFDLGNIGGL